MGLKEVFNTLGPQIVSGGGTPKCEDKLDSLSYQLRASQTFDLCSVPRPTACSLFWIERTMEMIGDDSSDARVRRDSRHGEWEHPASFCQEQRWKGPLQSSTSSTASRSLSGLSELLAE